MLITSFAIIIVVFFIVQKRKQIKNVLEQQQLIYDFDNSLLRTRIEVQEQSFETVSRDIHDGVGQVLSLGCMQLAHIKARVEDPVLSGRLDETLQLFKQSVKNLRLLSHSLNTSLVEQQSLEQAITAEIDRIEAFSSIKCKLIVDDVADDLSPEQRLVVFRIIQESLQNIMKHAEASQIIITIAGDGTNYTVQVKDDGVGFEVHNSGKPTSLGLLSMQQRTSILGATIAISSQPGTGTTVLLKIPIKYTQHERRVNY